MIVDLSEEDRVVVKPPRPEFNRNNSYANEYEYYDGYGDEPEEEEVKEQRSASEIL